jgi:hypothetical protein
MGGLTRIWQPGMRQSLKLCHSHLETVPQTQLQSLWDSASNWATDTWRLPLTGSRSSGDCLKLGHSHLETMPKTVSQSLGDSGSKAAALPSRSCAANAASRGDWRSSAADSGGFMPRSYV